MRIHDKCSGHSSTYTGYLTAQLQESHSSLKSWKKKEMEERDRDRKNGNNAIC